MDPIPPPPTILLNGSHHPLEHPLPLDQFLASIGLDGKPVVAELNERAIHPRDYPQTHVTPGDQLEIVTLAAGG
jgi:thiamine biosynthesis protein ThiS